MRVLTGDLTAAEGRLSRLSNRAENTLERVKLTCLRADLYTALDQGERAVAVCLEFSGMWASTGHLIRRKRSCGANTSGSAPSLGAV